VSGQSQPDPADRLDWVLDARLRLKDQPSGQETRRDRDLGPCENDPMRNTDGSILSIGSAGSILSIGSAGSILSIGSAGSILSIGSVGSVASVLSVGSAASAGSILSALSRWSVLAWRGRPGGGQVTRARE
jgi:hypothetical protein